MRNAGSALARYSTDSIEWPGDEPKVLAPMAAGSWDKVTTGAYMRMKDGNQIEHVDCT
jgi:hypothetical protein